MEKVRKLLMGSVCFLLMCQGAIFLEKFKKAHTTQNHAVETVQISSPKTQYKNYEEICQQLKTWHHESKSISEYSTYGKTSHGTECNTLRIGTKDKPKILVQSGLVGQEEFAVLCNMNLIHRLLSLFGTDKEITWLLKNRDIYFIPVVSPDTYLVSSDIDGHDPTKSFPSPQKPNLSSPSPVKALMDFACEMKFDAVLNFHTFGETLAMPEICTSKDFDKMSQLVDKMAGICGYKTHKTENKNGSGTETDWFYANGAFSIKMLWGKNSKQYVSYTEVTPAIDRNLAAISLFIKDAPEVKLNPRPLRTIYYYQGD